MNSAESQRVLAVLDDTLDSLRCARGGTVQRSAPRSLLACDCCWLILCMHEFKRIR